MMIIAVIYETFAAAKKKPDKKPRLVRDSNSWTLRYRCSTLPVKLTSMPTGSRSLNWFVFSSWKEVSVSFVPINFHRCWPREWKRSKCPSSLACALKMCHSPGSAIVHLRLNTAPGLWLSWRVGMTIKIAFSENSKHYTARHDISYLLDGSFALLYKNPDEGTKDTVSHHSGSFCLFHFNLSI